ncbi:MAG: cytochrome P460 family protein, partial [Bacteroidota bacterium]
MTTRLHPRLLHRPATLTVLAVILSVVCLSGQWPAIQEQLTAAEVTPAMWENYRTWNRLTRSPLTGDANGLLGTKHKGEKSYRQIYINRPKQALQSGSPGRVYPVGTVIVMEVYKSQLAWKTGKKPQVAVMVKLSQGANPEFGDWEWVLG